MRTDPRLLFFLVCTAAAPMALASACSGDNNTTTSSSGTSTGGSGGAAGAGGSGGSGGLFNTDAGSTCNSAADCQNGAICFDGVCCDKPENVCGGVCCAGGTVCLFDKCVTPGASCHTANDCNAGQYCETALGENGGSGGMGGMGGGPGCTQGAPLAGKCLDLPPKCDANGGPPGCVAACEYHPPAGKLDAIQKWSWGPGATFKPNFIDVWSTPAVGRVYDGNCDGKVDELDSPVVIFVSGKAIDVNTGIGTCCQCTNAATSACLTGVLRVLDGRTGKEVWSLDKASAASVGFSGVSVAIGDITKDGRMDIAAVTGEGKVVILDDKGTVLMTSDKAIPNAVANGTFGWGGGLAIADMDNDGFAEIAYGRTLFTTKDGALTMLWNGAAGLGGGAIYEALSTFVDLDGAADGHLELLAGRTAYKLDGTTLWDRTDLSDGFPAVGDFDGDTKPEIVLVGAGKLSILDAATGQNKLPTITLPGTGAGGPPTVADFDGDKKAEIGVAQQNFYTMLKPDFAANTVGVAWSVPNHDLSSSVTGSSVFDFEGDGRAEVIYADECFLWVYDGQTGATRFATPHTSFTATEASLVADVDGDGRSEIVMVSNGADPSANGWKCNMAPWNQPDPVTGRPAWAPPAGATAYRGVAVFGDKANSWVGTRTLWNQHTYHVTNICDDRDSACPAPNVYGSIPLSEAKNWTLPWLNNFRQNVQDKGIFDAPDATLSLYVECSAPLLADISVRNIGLASLPAGANVGVFQLDSGTEVLVGQGTTTQTLFPGQTEKVVVTLSGQSGKTSEYIARILIDPMNPTFHECREDNNASEPQKPACVQ